MKRDFEDMKGGMRDAKRHNVNTGSPKPKAPMSKRTSGPAGGKGPGYNPAAAAKHLNQAPPKC